MATEREIQQAFYNRNWQRYEIVVNNMYVTNAFSESDLFAVRESGFCDEIEIKKTKSDFNADFDKVIRKNCRDFNKHEQISNGDLTCNYFSFLIPEPLFDRVAIPDYAGVYLFSEWGGDLYVFEKKKPPRLHARKITLERKYKMLKKLQYRYWR